MFFVLAGSIALRLGETELEAVTSGGIFEMGMLENKPRRHAPLRPRRLCCSRSAKTRCRRRITTSSHLLELVSRVLVRRLRSTNSRFEGNNYSWVAVTAKMMEPFCGAVH